VNIEDLYQENQVLKKENEALVLQNSILQFRLEQLEKALFGSKRERFVPDENANQTSLFASDIEGGPSKSPESDDVIVGIIPKKKIRKKEIARNTFPVHLVREEQVIEPEGYQEGFKCIGQDETEILKYIPMELKVLKIIRPRYVDHSAKEKQIHQANIPARIIPKGLVDDSLIAGLISEKFEYHMPVYRFVKKLRNAGIDFIKTKHCYNYLAKTGEMLQPLHDLLHQEMLRSRYVQMDESSIRVLSQDQEHGKLRGCMWVMLAPRSDLVLFNYRQSKEKEHACDLLDGYEGVLQTDGNSSYKSIADAPPKNKIIGEYDIQVTEFLNCWAHTRRKFFEAKDLEPALIHPILKDIQRLYALEREARDKHMDTDQRFRLRQDKAVPVLNLIKKKLDEGCMANLTGPVKVAFSYALKRWPQLSNYVHNGDWEIDTNLLENKIRLLALGRKNFLFAKTDETAQHMATFYSIVATCHIRKIDVFKYLCWLLNKVTTEKITEQAINWLPHKIDPALFN
jgi:transposase